MDCCVSKLLPGENGWMTQYPSVHLLLSQVQGPLSLALAGNPESPGTSLPTHCPVCPDQCPEVSVCSSCSPTPHRELGYSVGKNAHGHVSPAQHLLT